MNDFVSIGLIVALTITSVALIELCARLMPPSASAPKRSDSGV